MNPDPKTTVTLLPPVRGQQLELPLEELVTHVYESAQPAVRNRMLARLVGKVFEAAPPSLRGRLLEQLLQPMGVLGLVAVAGGVFAKIRFRSGWPQMNIGMEDAQNVQARDVITLVDHVQQISSEAVNGLAQLLLNSPTMMTSAAAAVLVTLLMQRVNARRLDDAEL